MKSHELNTLSDALRNLGNFWLNIAQIAADFVHKFMAASEEGVPSTSTMEYGKSNPLRLNLQFFAEDPPGDDNPNDPPADPPDSDDDELTLADLLKTNPKIKAEYKTKVEAAVQKRFKNFDFDPEEARTALREKKEREANGDAQQTVVNQEITDLKKQNQKLLDRTKALNLQAYAGEAGLDPKLIVRLAGQQVNSLELNESFELDTDELDDIVDELRTEFPNLFTAAQPGVQTPGDDAPPPPAAKKSRYNPGSTQQTNNPPKATPNSATEVAETLARLKKLNRI